MSWSTKSPATMKLPKPVAALLSARRDTLVKNRVSFQSSTPNNLVFLPVASAMVSAHNGILCVACLQQQLLQQQLLQQFLLSQERFSSVNMKAETHVMILHTARKSVTATPTSVTHRQGLPFLNRVMNSKKVNCDLRDKVSYML